MEPFRRPRRPLRRAFTLIELIVVVVILAILMAIAVPAYISSRNAGNDTAASSDLSIAHRNVAAMIDEHGRYGADAADVAAKLSASEPGMSPVAAPAAAAVGQVQVDLLDDGQTAHLCTLSRSGVSFCLAMNANGGLDDGLPTVGQVATFRSWGHTHEAATCWLPTETEAPGANCAPQVKNQGGSGWAPAPLPAAEDTGDTGDTGDNGGIGPLPTNADFEDYAEPTFAGWADDSTYGGTVSAGEAHRGDHSAYLRGLKQNGAPETGYGTLTSELFTVDTTRNLILYVTGKPQETAYLTVEFLDAAGNVVATPVSARPGSDKPVYLPPPWQLWEPVTIRTDTLTPGEYRLRLRATSNRTNINHGVWVDTLHYEGDEIPDA